MPWTSKWSCTDGEADMARAEGCQSSIGVCSVAETEVN
jgi:hypothetical protein